MKQEKVLGLDLSLTCSAAVLIPKNWDHDFKSLITTTIGYPLKKDADEMLRLERLINIGDALAGFAFDNRVTHVFVEQYAFSSMASQAHAIGELGGYVKTVFHKACLPVKTVVASQARKHLFGKIPRQDAKLYVGQRLVQMGARFRTNDEGDAAVVANYGCHMLGWPALAYEEPAHIPTSRRK